MLDVPLVAIWCSISHHIISVYVVIITMYVCNQVLRESCAGCIHLFLNLFYFDVFMM
jgi:hypothetical protein